ncbi:MAG TPA: gamma-glutamylcyclotransferase [Spirochaetota bacterium]|nr:gamma-glutamylcyclotransferase [Spirochaetota bacterium]
MSEYIFVYGSLMKGFHNHDSFSFSSSTHFVCRAVLQGAVMFDMGFYPCVVLTGNPNNSVCGEVYRYHDMECRQRVQLMEYGAGFDEEVVTVDGIKASVFVYREKPEGVPWIPGGDWRVHSKGRVNMR